MPTPRIAVVAGDGIGTEVVPAASAPDIAGLGIANPIGAIWAGALMLDHLGHPDVHDAIVRAIEAVVLDGRVVTPDLGGSATTLEVTSAIRSHVAS